MDIKYKNENLRKVGEPALGKSIRLRSQTGLQLWRPSMAART